MKQNEKSNSQDSYGSADDFCRSMRCLRITLNGLLFGLGTGILLSIPRRLLWATVLPDPGRPFVVLPSSALP